MSDEILDQAVRAYRSLRNSIRFQLGAINDFSRSDHFVPVSEMSMIDLWAIGKTNELILGVTQSCEKYEFHRAIQAINRFCSGVLSSTYHDVIKDRLYTLHVDDPLRRSTQSAILLIFESLVKLIGPFAPFIADEAWAFSRTGEDYTDEFLALEDWPEVIESDLVEEGAAVVNSLLEFKDLKINESLEALRVKKEIGQSLDAELEILVVEGSELANALKKISSDELSELFIVSNVKVVLLSPNESDKVVARHASGVRCPRSWR